MPSAASSSAASAKSAEQRRAQARQEDGAGQDLIHRAQLVDRLLRVDVPDHALDGPGERARVALGAGHQRHAGRRALPHRQVDLLLRLALEPLVADVADDADHLALAVRVLDDLAERTAVGKVAAGHRLVDHAGARPGLDVALVEETALEQWDAASSRSSRGRRSGRRRADPRWAAAAARPP